MRNIGVSLPQAASDRFAAALSAISMPAVGRVLPVGGPSVGVCLGSTLSRLWSLSTSHTFPTGGDMQQASIAEGWGELARSNRAA